MSTSDPIPSIEEQVSRRRFLARIGATGCAVALVGCEVAEVSTSGGTDAKQKTFDVNNSTYKALASVGGMVAVNLGTTKILLIRATDQKVVALDRVCPHQLCEMTPGGIGSWQSGTSTLRCGCHGSEFKADGTYVDGSVSDGTTVASLKAYTVEFDAAAGTGKVSL